MKASRIIARLTNMSVYLILGHPLLRIEIQFYIFPLLLLQQYMFRMKLFLLITMLCPVFVIADPIAQPGHLMIKYYQKQVAERERLANHNLQRRCQSQISSGFVTDRRCQEWIENKFNDAKTNKATMGLTAICLVFTLFTRFIRR